jgi:hypothetical protein
MPIAQAGGPRFSPIRFSLTGAEPAASAMGNIRLPRR